MKKEKLLPRSKVVAGSDSIDSVKESKNLGDRRAFEVLFEAQQAWLGMHRFRVERERNKRYDFGRQWDDLITVDGETMTEEAYIKKQGNIPLKNNIIRRLVRAVLGVYRGQTKEPVCISRDRDEQKYGETMSTVLQYNMQLNKMSELYARSMEEFLISGLAIHRQWFGWRRDKCDCWTDNVQPNNFFIDGNMRDMRGWDVSLIGEIHDESFGSICQNFAKSPADVEKLKKIYGYAKDMRYVRSFYEEFGYDNGGNWSFLVPQDPSRCRVIEVWRKETKARYRCHDCNNGSIFKVDIEDYKELVEDVNEQRRQQGLEAGLSIDDIPFIRSEWFVDEYWYYYFLSPFGDIIDEGETPYEHKSHPYTFKAYPFIDGEIHSFVSDIIDQQRYVNRLITMHDWIMRASAKGVLLFPEDCKPDDLDMNDIADEWARFNGVIAIKKGARNLPQQIANNATNIGISELLNLQLKLVEDISGVSGSLQGKPGYSGMSASLYSQQTQNATTSLLDLLETFSSFVIDDAYKKVKNIQQYYDDKRVFDIAGRNGVMPEDNLGRIHDIEFDLSIAEGTSSPVYREKVNEFLKEIWRANQISLQQLLKVGHFDFADELLQQLDVQQQQVSEGNAPSGISPEVMQRAQQGADMGAVNKAHQMLMAG